MPQKTGLIIAWDRQSFTKQDQEQLCAVFERLPQDREFQLKLGPGTAYFEDPNGVSVQAQVRRYVEKFVSDHGAHNLHLFLDSKTYGTIHTVEAETNGLMTHHPFMVTCAWMPGMRTHKRFAEICNAAGSIPIGVTLLTDMNENDCLKHFGMSPSKLVVERSKHYLDCCCKGVTCSSRELKALGEAGLLPMLETIVPGTRRKKDHSNVHQRVTTPLEAVRDGATWLVFGSTIFGEPDMPITDPSDSIQSIFQILEDMDKA